MNTSLRAADSTAAQKSLPRIRGFGQLAATFALAAVEGLPITGESIGNIAKRAFPGSKYLPAIVHRANEVAGGNTGGWGAELAGEAPVAEFLAAVQYRDVLGRIGATEVPANVRLSGLDGEAIGYVVADGAAIPLSAPSFSTAVTVNPLKIATLIAVTNDLLRRGRIVDHALAFALLRAVTKATDEAFLSTNSYGVLNGISAVASTGTYPDDFDANLAEVLASLTGADPETISLVTTPSIALGLSLLRDSLEVGGRAYPDMTPKGGSISGIPVYVSAGVPSGSVVAIDGQAVVRGGDGIILESSRSATLEMNAIPAGNIGTPTAGSEDPVNLFTTESTGIKVVRSVGWKMKRSGCVGYITGFDPVPNIAST